MQDVMSEEKEEKGGGENSGRLLDDAAFLSNLRASGMPAHNDVTIGASNKSDEHRRDISNLSDVFDHSLETSLSASPGGASTSTTKKLPPRPPAMKLPPRPPAIHNRGRSVSWGNNHFIQTSLMQPNLESAPGSPGQVPRYTVNDMLSSGPYEQEVETNILKALEEQQARRGRADTGTSSILSGVPDDVAHDFTLSPSVDHSKDDSESEPSSFTPGTKQETTQQKDYPEFPSPDYECGTDSCRSDECHVGLGRCSQSSNIDHRRRGAYVVFGRPVCSECSFIDASRRKSTSPPVTQRSVGLLVE